MRTVFASFGVLLLGALVAGCSNSSMPVAETRTFVPPEAPTTGNKWLEDDSDPNGGRCFALADEECGGTDQADYLAYFEAPIFRSAAVLGAHAYAVDGSNLWVVDLSDPERPERVGLVTGVGRALAVVASGKRLYLAAAEAGLAVFSVDPADPARLRREASIGEAAPALDVAVDPSGRTAYVAAGARGVVPVSLDGPPRAGAAIPVPGFAAGIVAGSRLVYVAGCSIFSVLDPAGPGLVGTVALSPRSDQAPMPGKDVALSAGEDLAFVAAGRWGTLFIDLSNPAAPRLLGNRTHPDDLLYYANGVSVARDNLYVAAGDWGVDRMPVSLARASLGSPTAPARFARWCSPAEALERRPAPEFAVKLPPPRSQDPLDVVVHGDALLALGDASRLGVRALDVYRLAADGGHRLIGRYEEPGRLLSIAAGGGRVAVAGRQSGLFAPAAGRELLGRVRDLPRSERPARVLAFAGDGRLLALDDHGSLMVEGVAQPGGGLLLPSLVVDGWKLAGAREAGSVELFDLGSSGAEPLRSMATPRPFQHGAPAAFVGGRLYLASGDWLEVLGWNLGDPATAPVVLSANLLTRLELESPSAWRAGPPRRLLVPLDAHLAEVVSFAGRTSAVLHPVRDAGAARIRFALPSGVYAAGTSLGNRLFLVEGDRARYRANVVEVDFGDFTRPPRVGARAFAGSGVGICRLGERLYVADAEAGVRVFAIEDDGLRHLGDADLGGGP